MAPITTIASLFSSGTPFNAPLNGLDASSPDFLANVGDTKAKHGVAHAISTAIRTRKSRGAASRGANTSKMRTAPVASRPGSGTAE